MVEQIPRLAATIMKAIREDPEYKIIVFFVAARIVQACLWGVKVVQIKHILVVHEASVCL